MNSKLKKHDLKKPATQAGPQLWPVDGLKPHPRQHELFADLSQPQFDELVASIRRNGIENPLEILPDGTIVCGHQRRRAAIKVGLVEVPVVVRDDLAARGDDAVFERLIDDNLNRRQLGPFSRARAYRALREVQARQAGHRRLHGGDLRDLLGAQLGCSGRTLDRIERLLDLPQPVQAAIARGDLPMSLAENLFHLEADARLEAAKRIESGESARAVIRDLAPHRPPRLVRPHDAYVDLIHTLRRAQLNLAGRLENIEVQEPDRRVFVAGKELLDALIGLEM